MHRCIFAEGCPLSFPQSRMRWRHKTPASLQKVGAVSIISRLHGKSQPKGFRKPPGARVGQPPKRRRFILRQGPPLLLCSGVFLRRGSPSLPRNPEWDGDTKHPPLLQKVGAVFIFSHFQFGIGRAVDTLLPLSHCGSGAGVVFFSHTTRCQRRPTMEKVFPLWW